MPTGWNDGFEGQSEYNYPKGVELRLKSRLRRRQCHSKGPDFLWHIDSYDKLKQYGLCVNGCIDGFSRKIIWVNVYKTSSNPRVVAGYYIEPD